VLSDERYRRAAAAGGVGVWDWNLATDEIYVDPVLKQMLGYQDHEIRNQLDDWGRQVHPDDAATVLERAQAHIAGQTPIYEVEHRMLHRDGSVRWFLARGCATRDSEGRAVYLAGTHTDITERKRGEEALRQAEEINKRIAENTTDCVKILDIDGRLLYLNREGLRLLEVEDAFAVLHRPIVEFFTGEFRQAAEKAVASVRDGGGGRFQGPLRTPSGITRWWDVLVTPITDRNGAVVQMLAVSRDITERRRDEAFRVARHQIFEMIATGSTLPEVLDCVVRLVEQQSDGMSCSALLLDDDGVTMRHGAAPSLPADYVHAIDGARIGPRTGCCGTAMFHGKRVIATDILADPLWEDYRAAARMSGRRACWSAPIFSPQQRVLGSFAMYFIEPRAPRDEELGLIEAAADIARIAIEQHRAQHALRQSEARNRAIVRAIPDWMFLTTADGIFIDYHAKDVSQSYTPSAFLGKNIKDVLPSPASDRLLEACARVRTAEEPEKVEYALGADDTQRFYEACVVGCDGDKVLTIVRDVTDRKTAEVEVAAQRLELAHLGRVAVLGELTGALAHELSQPLTAVLTNAQASRRFVDREPLDVPELRASLDDIISDNRRAAAVINRLRALLRKEASVLQPVDLNEVVREVVDLAHSEIIARAVTVTSTLAPGTPFVLGDRVQLQQVILNLLLNACDAMSATPLRQRRLALTTAADDGFAQLAVADCGTGIPQEHLERVFEPFVTFRDEGLGLGLAISRSIVTAHNGSIQAENNTDGGATFRCFLPLAEATAIRRART
jgi:PAS domain S-box-containing protein